MYQSSRLVEFCGSGISFNIRRGTLYSVLVPPMSPIGLPMSPVETVTHVPGTDPDFIGDPGWIRTSDLQLRRLLLYPLSYGALRDFSG